VVLERLSKNEAKKRAEERLAQLLDLPLFSDLEYTRDALEFEVRLSYEPALILDGMPQRPSYIRFESCEPGQVLVNQGDLTTHLFVVLEGLVNVFYAEPGQGTELFNTYERGGWFGEVSSLSNQPSLTTARTQTTSELAVIDARLFKKLYAEEEDGPFQEQINARYRQESLLLHLKVSELFAGVPREKLLKIRDGAQFISFKKGKTIAAQGDEAKDFFLVRSGAIQCYKQDGVKGKQRVFAYHKANSSFGEHSITTDDPRWPGTYETMAPTDVVRIPREIFERVRHEHPEAFHVLKDRAARLSAEEIEILVHKQSVKGGEPLVIDRAMCIRCNVCVESCAAVHGDHVPRLSKVGNRASEKDVLITACYNCEIPECMAECDYGAIRRDAQGMVRFVYDNCVGCTLCTKGCPYGVIRMTEPRAHEPASERPTLLQGLLTGVPFLRHLVGRKPTEPSTDMKVMSLGGEGAQVDGKAIKCDSCAGLPFEACVYNCPTSAIHRRSPEDLFKI